MAQFFNINNKTIKSPSEISLSCEDLDKAERTIDGTMVVDLIGIKRKVDVSWEYLSKEDMAVLSGEVKSRNFVTITFHDNATGALTTMTARPKDLAYLPYYDWAKAQIMWKSVAISFVER